MKLAKLHALTAEEIREHKSAGTADVGHAGRHASSKWLFQNPDVKFVNINVSPFHFAKLDAVKVIADAREGLDAVASMPEGTEDEVAWMIG